MKIQKTNTYKAFDKTTASVVNQASSRKRIMSSVEIVKTIGFEKWKTVTDLPKKWYNIVKELAD